MMQKLYCSMIHGGLELNFKDIAPTAQHCCLRGTRFEIDPTTNFWNNKKFVELRDLNKKNIWDPGCRNCQALEESNLTSFRQGMNQGLGIEDKFDISGPARIDLMFDRGCNLACRTCGPNSSTYWEKHLKQHGLWKNLTVNQIYQKDQVIAALTQLDLANLKQLVFCGGETLMGNAYWEVAKWLADNVPHAKQSLTLCFQTNGTQNIPKNVYETIEKFHIVKLHISLDGITDQFEYLRWPATWSQVTDNILSLKQNLPNNVMFVVEETISIFNLPYLDKLEKWVEKNFVANREGDTINHTRHLAQGIYSLNNCSEEYVIDMQSSKYFNLIPKKWQENHQHIQKMIKEIAQFDQLRNQKFSKIFPEVHEYYKRFV